METLLLDLKHALRLIGQNAAFTATVVFAVALGIGVNTAVFSVVNEVLLEPVRVPEPERLVFVMSRDDRGATFPHR